METSLADTNVWLRFVDAESQHHSTAVEALTRITEKATLILIPQNVVEFWVVATRPRENNGLGWSPAKAEMLLSKLRQQYDFRPDSEDLTDRWLSFVQKYNVQGKRAHDARLMVAALVQNVHFLVTFNVSDFRSWRLSVLHPGDVSHLLR